MNADVILKSTERRIILDTKFYKDALARGRGTGTGKLHSPNLYQLLAYVRNRQPTRPDGPRHLDRDWRLIHDEMLETVGAGGGWPGECWDATRSQSQFP